jgi:hypothetical protein
MAGREEGAQPRLPFSGFQGDITTGFLKAQVAGSQLPLPAPLPHMPVDAKELIQCSQE